MRAALCVQLADHPNLVTYVERIGSEAFAAPLPAAPPITSAEWAQRAEEAAAPSASARCACRGCLAARLVLELPGHADPCCVGRHMQAVHTTARADT